MIELQHQVIIKHNGRWSEINQWLKDNSQDMYSKNISYPTNKAEWESVTMNFNSSEDAMLFKLRWG